MFIRANRKIAKKNTDKNGHYRSICCYMTMSTLSRHNDVLQIIVENVIFKVLIPIN